MDRRFKLVSATMDLTFEHSSTIYRLVPCRNNEAQDLVAIGGDNSVDILQVVGPRIYLQEKYLF